MKVLKWYPIPGPDWYVQNSIPRPTLILTPNNSPLPYIPTNDVWHKIICKRSNLKKGIINIFMKFFEKKKNCRKNWVIVSNTKQQVYVA